MATDQSVQTGYQANAELKPVDNKPNLVVSACILGNPVRYNGGHKNNYWINQVLSEHVNLMPICPEVDMGMSIPRKTIHIQHHDEQQVRLVDSDLLDVTEQAQQQIDRYHQTLPWKSTDAFILQAKSPSCGVDNVKVFNQKQNLISHKGVGLFAAEFKSVSPNIPKIDSGRLHNAELRQQFLINLFAHFRFRTSVHSLESLQFFHRGYKYLLMECNQLALKRMGRLVAEANKEDFELVCQEYEQVLVDTLSVLPSRGTRANTFQHIMGYLKQQISGKEKTHLLDVLDQYRKGICGFEVPRALLKYLIHLHEIDYIKDQYYFEPFPQILVSS